MGLGRYMVDAVLLEGRRPTELARNHGISRSWIYRLVARYRQGGYQALDVVLHQLVDEHGQRRTASMSSVEPVPIVELDPTG